LLTFALYYKITDRNMFGIEDPGIWLPYVLGVACLIFSAWWGISKWNKDDESDENETTDKRYK